MVRPLKVSEKGAPLSCNEFDTNIDRLLDRTNHTGKQKCNTISDLAECVENFGFIQDFKDELALISDRLNLFTDDIIQTQLASSVTSLRDELLLLIKELNGEIDENDVDITNIFKSITSIRNNILAIESVIATIPDIQTTNNDLYLSLQQLLSDFSTEISNRSQADSALQVQLSNEVATRSQAITNEANTRIAGDDKVRAEYISDLTDTGNFFTNRINTLPKPKAWIAFDGKTGRVFNAFNVSAITKLDRGVWRIFWTKPFTNSQYIVQLTSIENTFNYYGALGEAVDSPTDPFYINPPVPIIANLHAPPAVSNGEIQPTYINIKLWGLTTTDTSDPYIKDIHSVAQLNPSYLSVVAYE